MLTNSCSSFPACQDELVLVTLSFFSRSRERPHGIRLRLLHAGFGRPNLPTPLAAADPGDVDVRSNGAAFSSIYDGVDTSDRIRRYDHCERQRSSYTWSLPNGDVSLTEPLTFPGMNRCLKRPRLLGSGGRGAVRSNDKTYLCDEHIS